MHVAWLAAISMLGLTGAAASDPSPLTCTTWVGGRLERVDLTRHALVVRDGSRELTLRLAPDAEIRQGARAVAAQALTASVGCPVRVRYAADRTGPVADMVDVRTPGSDAEPAR
ncbi:MAG: hypothetical protein R2708_02220 [Vicinamibacterales bacterium]|jgi:hypothetical protein